MSRIPALAGEGVHPTLLLESSPCCENSIGKALFLGVIERRLHEPDSDVAYRLWRTLRIMKAIS